MAVTTVTVTCVRSLYHRCPQAPVHLTALDDVIILCMVVGAVVAGLLLGHLLTRD